MVLLRGEIMKRIHRIVAACVAGVLVFAIAQAAIAQGVLAITGSDSFSLFNAFLV
jgi:hypothetical protein